VTGFGKVGDEVGARCSTEDALGDGGMGCGCGGGEKCGGVWVS
jgi:hypothetical protein